MLLARMFWRHRKFNQCDRIEFNYNAYDNVESQKLITNLLSKKNSKYLN